MCGGGSGGGRCVCGVNMCVVVAIVVVGGYICVGAAVMVVVGGYVCVAVTMVVVMYRYVCVRVW